MMRDGPVATARSGGDALGAHRGPGGIHRWPPKPPTELALRTARAPERPDRPGPARRRAGPPGVPGDPEGEPRRLVARFNMMSPLGGALLGQGRYAEAEPLVVPGYEGMK